MTINVSTTRAIFAIVRSLITSIFSNTTLREGERERLKGKGEELIFIILFPWLKDIDALFIENCSSLFRK